VVAVPGLLERLDLNPFGVSIATSRCFDPTRSASAPFLRRLERLDALTFGPLDMATPRWALYDCAELPGVVFGFVRMASSLPERVSHVLGADGSGADLIPVSMYIAVPTLQSGHWLAYAIADLSEAFPGASPPELRTLSVALGLRVLRAQRVSGTAQWASPTMRVHARFAPLEIRAAWLPAHTDPATCAFRFPADGRCLRKALGTGPAVTDVEAEMLDVGDAAALVALQRDIESGRRAVVVGPPEERGALLGVPIRRHGRAVA
jgi:hypothetical protein